jgi:DNA-binding transcriptional LysR family regulator
VRITPAGQALLPLARACWTALADGSEALTALRHQGEGVVRVAAITSAISGLLVRAVPAFALAHPGLQVQVRECDVDQCALLLARR